MTQAVAHDTQIGTAVGHMRSGRVAQSVRGGLFEQISLSGDSAAAQPQLFGCTGKDALDDRVQRLRA